MSKTFLKSPPCDNSWRAIAQSGSGLQGVTIHAKKRYFSLCLKTGLSFFCLGLLIVALIFAIYFFKNQALSITLPVKHIEIQTNGVLTTPLITSFLGLPKEIGIMSVDIFELQRRLESIEQIQEAIVERQFPDSIKITIREYLPIVKLICINESGKRQGLLVSKEGNVFKGYGYSKKKLQSLPYLTGIQLYKKGNAFKKIDYMTYVDELLSCARLASPELFKYWKSISLEYCLYGNQDIGAFIKVRTKNLGEIIFAPEKFDLQLGRLNSIVSYASKQKLATIERIDLSLENQAVVKVMDSK